MQILTDSPCAAQGVSAAVAGHMIPTQKAPFWVLFASWEWKTAFICREAKKGV